MDSKWIELSVKTPQEYVEPLSHIFTRYGQGVSVEVEDSFNPDEGEEPKNPHWATVRTYLPLDATSKSRRSQIDVAIQLVSKVAPISPLQERILDEKEWENAWKRHFYVLHIGARIVIRPPWRRYQPKPHQAVVNLDPGMAFGTGHHPTTHMCLLELERLLKPGMTVLDIGTGSGILSIAAAKLGASRVLALDVDPIAIKVAKENVAANGVGSIVKVSHGSLPSPQAIVASQDLVLANISAKVVSGLSEELIAVLKPEGKLVTSGIIQDKKDEIEECLKKAGGNVDYHRIENDWITLVISKSSSMMLPKQSNLTVEAK